MNKGGRPRSPTLSELKRQQASLSSGLGFNKNGGNRLPTGLRELREMWKRREESSAVNCSPPGGFNA